MRIRLRALTVLAALAGTFLFTAPAASHAEAATSARVYRGNGNAVVRIPVTSAPSMVKVTYKGNSNFMVWTLSTSGKQVDQIVNALADYKGTAAFNVTDTQKIRSLKVKTKGSWTLQVLPIAKARNWAIKAKGTGSDVLRLTAPSKGPHRLTLRHSGKYNFIVWALDNRGRPRDLLVNEIGSYKGRVALPAGTRYVTITADGTWTITRG